MITLLKAFAAAVLGDLAAWAKKHRRLLLIVLGVVVLVVALWALFALGQRQGQQAERRVWENRARLAAAETRQREAKADAITATVSGELATRQVEIRWRTRTLTKEVQVYVPASADAHCVVPVGLVRLHDAAAAGLAEPAGGPEQTPSGVALSSIAATVVANYGAAHELRAEVLAWRSWYDLQKAAWDAPAAKVTP